MLRFKPRASMYALLATVLAVVLVAVAACGGSSSTGPKTYNDSKYHYSFQYPGSWALQEGSGADVSAGGSSGSSVGVYDPNGAVAEGTCVDMVLVSVYRLKVKVSDATMPDIKDEVEQVLGSLESQAGDLQAVEALADTTAAGMKGYKATYSFAKNEAPVRSTLYFLFAGDLEYQVTVQAAEKSWQADQKVFQAILDSFKPGTD